MKCINRSLFFTCLAVVITPIFLGFVLDYIMMYQPIAELYGLSLGVLIIICSPLITFFSIYFKIILTHNKQAKKELLVVFFSVLVFLMPVYILYTGIYENFIRLFFYCLLWFFAHCILAYLACLFGNYLVGHQKIVKYSKIMSSILLVLNIVSVLSVTLFSYRIRSGFGALTPDLGPMPVQLTTLKTVLASVFVFGIFELVALIGYFIFKNKSPHTQLVLVLALIMNIYFIVAFFVYFLRLLNA